MSTNVNNASTFEFNSTLDHPELRPVGSDQRMNAAIFQSPTKTRTPSKLTEHAGNAYRLLYRGALSLPDSHLLLDGVTFTARLDSPSKRNDLLQNPLALALETMRGRPSIRFIGVIDLQEPGVWLDESGGVEMDIHPYATLTRIYFENIFCLTPLASTSTSDPTAKVTSSVGVKVAVDDSDGPETTQMVIYARPSEKDAASLNLLVARLTPRPPPPPQKSSLRIPRPDDPTPRKPMALFGAGKRDLKRMSSTSALSNELKRVASSSNLVPAAKRKKLGEGAAAELGSNTRVGVKKADSLFKIPEVPVAKVKGKGKAKADEGVDDVFGASEGSSSSFTKNLSRGKDVNDDDGEGSDMERANKNVIKRAALNYLQKTKDPTLINLPKTHPDFKDLFGWIYRGVCFALRSEIKLRSLEATKIERLVRIHTDMYVGGFGGTGGHNSNSNGVGR